MRSGSKSISNPSLGASLTGLVIPAHVADIYRINTGLQYSLHSLSLVPISFIFRIPFSETWRQSRARDIVERGMCEKGLVWEKWRKSRSELSGPLKMRCIERATRCCALWWSVLSATALHVHIFLAPPICTIELDKPLFRDRGKLLFGIEHPINKNG